ncbi:hypothetical protein AAC387_Pa01g1193 [Persea americana]
MREEDREGEDGRWRWALGEGGIGRMRGRDGDRVELGGERGGRTKGREDGEGEGERQRGRRGREKEGEELLSRVRDEHGDEREEREGRFHHFSEESIKGPMD